MTRAALGIARMALMVLFVVFATAIQAETASIYDSQSSKICDDGIQTSLDGVVVLRKEYGAPGWGEDPAHDARWTMVILRLTPGAQEQVRHLMSSCASDPQALTEVQLWIPDKAGSKKDYSHARVHVHGHLYPSSGPPAEILTFQLDVVSIQKY